MSIQNRDKMISAFCEDPNVTVFLMSLKAGGVALNLTAASHVMLMVRAQCLAVFHLCILKSFRAGSEALEPACKGLQLPGMSWLITPACAHLHALWRHEQGCSHLLHTQCCSPELHCWS